jgi:hypothetical protein
MLRTSSNHNNLISQPCLHLVEKLNEQLVSLPLALDRQLRVQHAGTGQWHARQPADLLSKQNRWVTGHAFGVQNLHHLRYRNLLKERIDLLEKSDQHQPFDLAFQNHAMALAKDRDRQRHARVPEVRLRAREPEVSRRGLVPEASRQEQVPEALLQERVPEASRREQVPAA